MCEPDGTLRELPATSSQMGFISAQGIIQMNRPGFTGE